MQDNCQIRNGKIAIQRAENAENVKTVNGNQ